MSAINSIPPDKLARLIGTPNSPRIIDVRSGDERSASGGFLPASVLKEASTAAEWARQIDTHPSVVICADGDGVSAGVAAWLRHFGSPAEMLEGGVSAWAEKGYPLVPFSKLPPREPSNGSVWVTRARPKVDRIACPWLIRRFVDPDAVFLFVAPGDVTKVAEQFQAAPFDVDGVFWSHRGELCTFDTMVEEFRLGSIGALARLAVIVRGADTARPDLAPQAAGLVAASLGLSRMYSDDLEQLEAGMLIYDAFYRWCRDAVDETHDWVSHQPKKRGKS